MEENLKQLLFKDLCTRLPYDVILQISVFDNGDIKYYNKKLDCDLLKIIELDGGYYSKGNFYKYQQFSAKPYLRPMSSMENSDWFNYFHSAEMNFLEHSNYEDYFNAAICGNIAKYDWLNKHHFDYRQLIEKGLAIEVTKENNPYKD